jgi:hypothetical protein
LEGDEDMFNVDDYGVHAYYGNMRVAKAPGVLL